MIAFHADETQNASLAFDDMQLQSRQIIIPDKRFESVDHLAGKKMVRGFHGVPPHIGEFLGVVHGVAGPQHKN